MIVPVFADELVIVDDWGYRDLYRPISYRTAGGSCVCSRKIEYGGITLKNHLQKEVVLL